VLIDHADIEAMCDIDVKCNINDNKSSNNSAKEDADDVDLF
jgi:hypothetical protein